LLWCQTEGQEHVELQHPQYYDCIAQHRIWGVMVALLWRYCGKC
jgi:hypothetical protein